MEGGCDVTFYGSQEKTVDIDFEVDDDEILEYILEDEKRANHFRAKIGACTGTAREVLDSMKSLDRDAFLADLCRECALLGIEWPVSEGSK